MSTGAFCPRCGSRRIIPAHLEHSTGFCVDARPDGEPVHIGLRAGVCQHCGHVEFWVPDPGHLLDDPETEEPEQLPASTDPEVREDAL